MFINYFDGTYKVQSHRLCDAIVTTLDDVLISIEEQSSECLSVSVDKDTLIKLSDSKYLADHGIDDIELVSSLYNELKEVL